MYHDEFERLLREKGVEPKPITDDAEAHRAIYKGLRESDDVMLVSGEFHPDVYNNSPEVLGLDQRMRVDSGWVRYVYHSSLIMHRGDRQSYFRGWLENLDRGINYLEDHREQGLFSTDDLIEFHKSTRRGLSRIRNGELDDRIIVSFYPQGEILNVLDRQEEGLRLQVYSPFVRSDPDLRQSIEGMVEAEIRKWVEHNEENFGFEIDLAHEADVYDVVVNPGQLDTVWSELIGSRIVAKPEAIPFAI